MPLALAVLVSLLFAGPSAPPLAVGLVSRDAAGCGVPALLTGPAPLALTGAAPGLCVREALSLRLEDAAPADVVLRVAHRGHDRIFVYRLEGARLVPRFLGSGPHSLELIDLRREAGLPLDALLVRARRGATEVLLRCRFEEFPLVCAEVP